MGGRGYREVLEVIMGGRDKEAREQEVFEGTERMVIGEILRQDW